MLRSVTVKLHQDLFRQIRVIAEKKGETISDTIRYLLKRGLEERIYEENTELIASFIRREMDHAIRSYAIYPSLDNVEHPNNSAFTERLILVRSNKDENLPS
ncbi:MAG TPA: hypothetical protein VFC73_03215 [Syntrophomonadaceae bacterium]|nr:hypothetical protein [Syntrophomonadaceae bacterium]